MTGPAVQTAATAQEEPSPWIEIPVGSGEPAVHRVGEIEIRFGLRDAEFRVRTAYPDAPDPTTFHPSETGAEESWVRWPCAKEEPRLHLLPRMPDRAVVARLDQPVALRPGGSVRLYILVPAWVDGKILPDPALPVLDLGSERLSNTWFGSYTDGELAYSLRTAATTVPADAAHAPHRICCPMRVSNDAEETLRIERLCLRVRHLTVFRSASRLWSDASRSRYLGKGRFSELSFGGTAPEEARDAERVTEPRIPARRSWTARTFASLKTLSGLGVEEGA